LKGLLAAFPILGTCIIFGATLFAPGKRLPGRLTGVPQKVTGAPAWLTRIILSPLWSAQFGTQGDGLCQAYFGVLRLPVTFVLGCPGRDRQKYISHRIIGSCPWLLHVYHLATARLNAVNQAERSAHTLAAESIQRKYQEDVKMLLAGFESLQKSRQLMLMHA
jgi:hypothetical protein